jgi:flagellar biosynthesis GTPase FlhF
MGPPSGENPGPGFTVLTRSKHNEAQRSTQSKATQSKPKRIKAKQSKPKQIKVNKSTTKAKQRYAAQLRIAEQTSNAEQSRAKRDNATNNQVFIYKQKIVAEHRIRLRLSYENPAWLATNIGMTNGFSKSNWIPASQQPHSREDCKPRRFDLRDADNDSEKVAQGRCLNFCATRRAKLSQERVRCYTYSRRNDTSVTKFEDSKGAWTPTQVTTHAPSVSSREHV